MAVYLNEREVGFDPQVIGFPSIDSCMGIVVVTNNGLFGLHNLGGSGNHEWAGKAATFATYFNRHFLRSGITRIYGATHVLRRGYAAPQRTSWIGELTAFAGALNFNGPIRGISLTSNVSEYVEFTKAGDKCVVMVKDWNDHDRTTGPIQPGAYHKYLHPAGGGQIRELSAVPSVTVRVTNVNTANMHQKHSERLRG